MCKISIAMTTYNGEKYLKEQLDSLYSQTLLPDEIVVVDDCSTDSTSDILEEYHKSKGLIYIINDTNLGVNKNFEKAIRLCKGEYIAICDQDDIWLTTKIERSINKLREIEKNNLPSLVTSEKIDIDKLGEIIYRPKQKGDSDEYYISLFNHYMQGCTMFMNRKLLEYILPLPDRKEIMYDVFIGLTASMVGNKYNIGEPLMYYRRHENNVTGRIGEKTKIKKSIFEKYFPFYSKGRFNNMYYVDERNSSYFIPDRKNLYYKIIDISSEKNILLKIYKILSIKELSKSQKLQAVINTIFNTLRSCKILSSIRLI